MFWVFFLDSLFFIWIAVFVVEEELRGCGTLQTPCPHPPPAGCLPLFALLLSPPPPHESLIVLAAGDGGRERVKSLAPLGEKAPPVSFALTVQQCGSNHASTSL